MTERAPPPKEFLCSLTRKLMTDPVRTADQRVWERTALLNSSSTDGRWPLAYQTDDELRVRIETWKQQPVAFDVEVETDHASGQALVRVRVPGTPVRKRVHMVLVLDVSASMRLPAGEKSEAAEISRLDIVRHASKTCVAMLSSIDAFTLVTYSSTAEVRVRERAMDAAGKQMAMHALDALHPTEDTQMYKGIRAALDAANPRADTFTHIVVLTDGEPTDVPVRGWSETIRSNFERLHPSMMVSTVGFGMAAELRADLLAEIAVQGRGHYAYIADASTVGTTMVHFTAQSLNVAACGVRLFEPFGVEFTTVPCDAPACALVELARVEKVETVRVRSAEAPLHSASEVRVDVVDGMGLAYEGARAQFLGLLRAACAQLDAASKRVPGKTQPEDAALVESLANEFVELAAEFAASTDAKVRRLAEDMYQPDNPNKGQVIRGIRAWDKWGRMYLPSLISTHAMRWCTGFKESAPQDYKGALMDALIDEGEKAFLSLPPIRVQKKVTVWDMSMQPPPSSVQLYSYLGPAGATRGGGQGGMQFGFSTGIRPMAAATASYSSDRRSLTTLGTPQMRDIDMQKLSASSQESCFGPEAFVETARRGFVRVRDVRPGEWVYAGTRMCDKSGTYKVYASVSLVVHYPASALVLYGAAGITAHHPVRYGLDTKNWVFPKDAMVAQKFQEKQPVYNLVLTGRTGISHFRIADMYRTVENVNFMHRVAIFNSKHEFCAVACTLGHGIADNDVVMHPYFGSREAVMRDLAKFPGFEEGVVRVPDTYELVRDKETGLVCGMRC